VSIIPILGYESTEGEEIQANCDHGVEIHL
jgi:hypothetical protein